MLPTRRRHGYVMDVVNMSDLNQSEGLRTLGVRISWDTLRGKLIYEVTSPPGSIRVLRGPMGQKVYLACYDVHLSSLGPPNGSTVRGKSWSTGHPPVHFLA